MIAIDLKTEHLTNPVGIDAVQPLLSWLCKDGITQTAYEIEAAAGEEPLWASGKVETNQMNALLDARLASKQRVVWRVRLWDENGKAGAWSEEAYFEMGILEKNQFVAKWINPELTCQPEAHKPASYLKTSFCAPEGKQARLYITCHGLYEAYLNGQRVGSFVLAPGCYSYNKKLAYQTYDVTDLIQKGGNEVLVILGDGWYRGCTGVDGDTNLYGEDIALFFQLEVDGKPVCVSNEDWQATQMGPLRENDMQQGEVYDARIEELTGWHAVKPEDFGVENLACSNCVPIAERERFAGKLMQTPNGETVIDYGQNLAGYIEFTVNAHAGDTLVLTHGEALDAEGNFTAENFQDRQRHKQGGTEQRVVYTCRDGLNHYKAMFTIWGFRYARVETSIDLSNASFTAIAVYSDMEDVGSFECSNPDVNQLVQNSIWSMKSNFCDVPTDCPTRERAAWTGDMAVFADTGLYLADCYTVIRKWLAECRLCQYEDGKIANIAPRNNFPTPFAEMLAGSVGWGDACIIVPYALYNRFGDIRILKENYGMMGKWYHYLERRAQQPGEHSGEENPYANYTIDTGLDYGEWCEPDADVMATMSRPQFKVATAYLASSGRLLAEIAQLLGQHEDAAHYSETAENAAKAFHLVATDNGKITSEHQAEYVRAISFGLLSQNEAAAAAGDLNQLIIANGCHLNTGFLSTPALCMVLARYGYLDTAYRLLLQDTMPSWLYAVKKGATTIWENWDGINEKGEPKASLNHYSYGAISGWLFSGVCGIRVEKNRVRIEPQPCDRLEYAKAVYKSPVGVVSSGWKYEGKKIAYEISIPPNVTADVLLPDGRSLTLAAGTHCL